MLAAFMYKSGHVYAAMIGHITANAFAVIRTETGILKWTVAVSYTHLDVYKRQVYTSPDVLGMELGGSLKNVIALAAGMVYTRNTSFIDVYKRQTYTSPSKIRSGINLKNRVKSSVEI